VVRESILDFGFNPKSEIQNPNFCLDRWSLIPIPSSSMMNPHKKAIG
jgi:hypothetical protein